MQATPTSLNVLKFDFEAGSFSSIQSAKVSGITKIIGINQQKLILLAGTKLVMHSLVNLSECSLLCEQPVRCASLVGRLLVALSENEKGVQYLMILDGYSLIWRSNDQVNELGCHSSILFNALKTTESGLFRSPTDLTVPLHSSMQQSIESFSQKHVCKIEEIMTVGADGYMFLVLRFETGDVCVYQMLLDQLTSFKLIKKLPQLNFNGADKCLFSDCNQVFIAANPEVKVLTFRRGRVLTHSMPLSGFYGYASIQAPAKPNSLRPTALSMFFLGLVKNSETETALVMCKHPPSMFFDVRQSTLISDGLTLKRIPLEGRGIKTMVVHEQYLVVATFKTAPTLTAPSKISIEQGFSPNHENMAPDYNYQIEVYALPSVYRPGSTGKVNWKEMTQLQKPIIVFSDLQSDQIVTEIKSLTLEVAPQRKETFLCLCTIKLDRQLEKTQFQSCMAFYQIVGNKLECMFMHPQKRMVSQLHAYRDKLLSVQKNKQDLDIVIQGIKLNSQFNLNEP